MCAIGMSYSDISAQVEEIYDISVSKTTINAIADKFIDEVKASQFRCLDSVYRFG